ncbi:MAG: nuclear transport factor 2 family protein [Solirubrobacteraceae bacterium]|jgi:copper chaperone CopZ
MRVQLPAKRAGALLCGPAIALLLASCGSAVSTTAFKGEEHGVAQAIANLQSNATAGEEKKICEEDLAGPLVTRLGGVAGCETAIKSQLAEVDSFEVTVESIKLAGDTATASVKSVYAGKNRIGNLTLVKEAGKWKVSGLA